VQALSFWQDERSAALKRSPHIQGDSCFEKCPGDKMRILVVVVILLTVAEVIDAVWFDGHYGRAFWQNAYDEVGQAKNQITSITDSGVARAPKLSRFWTVPWSSSAVDEFRPAKCSFVRMTNGS
jgi:hypothetical protein